MYSKSLAMCQQPRSVKQKRNETSACDNHRLDCVTRMLMPWYTYSRHYNKPIHTKWYISRISYPRFKSVRPFAHIFLQTFAKQQKRNSTTPQLGHVFCIFSLFFSHWCYILPKGPTQPPYIAAFLISAQGFQGFQALELPSTKRPAIWGLGILRTSPWRGADGLPWWCGYVQVPAWRWKIRGTWWGGEKKAYGKNGMIMKSGVGVVSFWSGNLWKLLWTFFLVGNFLR